VHPKLILLHFRDNKGGTDVLRVCVMSGNLYLREYEFTAQSMWCQDFPLYPDAMRLR
jgi:hypothetical protein